MPVYASGLSGQVGAVAETTYGTPVTVTHFYEFLSENFQYVPAFLDGMGLKAGQAYNRSTRTVVSQFDVNGDLTMEHTSGEAANAVADSMGFWWKWAPGTTTSSPEAGRRRASPLRRSTRTSSSNWSAGSSPRATTRPRPDTRPAAWCSRRTVRRIPPKERIRALAAYFRAEGATV